MIECMVAVTSADLFASTRSPDFFASARYYTYTTFCHPTTVRSYKSQDFLLRIVGNDTHPSQLADELSLTCALVKCGSVMVPNRLYLKASLSRKRVCPEAHRHCCQLPLWHSRRMPSCAADTATTSTQQRIQHVARQTRRACRRHTSTMSLQCT